MILTKFSLFVLILCISFKFVMWINNKISSVQPRALEETSLSKLRVSARGKGVGAQSNIYLRVHSHSKSEDFKSI